MDGKTVLYLFLFFLFGCVNSEKKIKFDVILAWPKEAKHDSVRYSIRTAINSNEYGDRWKFSTYDTSLVVRLSLLKRTNSNVSFLLSKENEFGQEFFYGERLWIKANEITAKAETLRFSGGLWVAYVCPFC